MKFFPCRGVLTLLHSDFLHIPPWSLIPLWRLYKGSLRQTLDHSWISVHVYRLTVHHHLDYPLLDISEFSRLGLNALDNRQPRSEDCTCKSSVSSWLAPYPSHEFTDGFLCCISKFTGSARKSKALFLGISPDILGTVREVQSRMPTRSWWPNFTDNKEWWEPIEWNSSLPFILL